MRQHEWRAIMQYSLTNDEARMLVQGYGHPEVDEAPVRMLAGDEKPAIGDPRVFLGTHNLLRDEALVVCWNCELAWDPEVARRECSGVPELFPDLPSLGVGIGNMTAPMGTVGRNDPCPCGSGLKFKRCHGAN